MSKIKNQKTNSSVQEVTVSIPQVQQKEKYPNTIEEGKKYSYNFWKNKPVQKFDQMSVCSEQIEDDLQKRAVYGNNESIKLPESMKWIEIDMNDNESLQKVIDFLKLYYVKNKFRSDYTSDFLRWVISSDGFMIAIVDKLSNSICGTIGASIKHITVFDKTEKFGNVNFLCAHPMYRKKKIAFTLIDEAVRRIVKRGVNRGCFTTERCVPTPITVMRYYHRPINYLKLQKYGFCDAGGNPEIVHKKFEVKNEFPLNCNKMNNTHIKECYKLYRLFISRFNVYCEYSEEEFENMLIDNKFVKSYVVVENDKVVDFMSYYVLPYSIENVDEQINCAYLFLHSCNKITGGDMVEKMFQILKINEMDLLHVTDTMLMSDVLLTKELKNAQNSDADDYDNVFEHKFLKGNGKLHFNLFNWKCPEIKPRQISWFSF